jgi:hypothetical protein
MRLPVAVTCLMFPFAAALGYPPGSPMSEFGPSQVAVGVFFDHSGQDLYEEGAPSLLNAVGLNLDYAPLPYVQVGVFAGAVEFDVGIVPRRLSDTSARAFNTDYSMYGGASAKLATPRFLSHSTRLVGYGAAGYFKNDDGHKNVKRGLHYNAGATLQWIFRDRLNFALGGEFHAIDGEQKSSRNEWEPMGLTAPLGMADYLRGVAGVEYFFKGANRPFISVAFRPSGSLGWDDRLGLRNGSISVSMGAMTTLGGGGGAQVQEEETGMADE